MSLFSFNKIAAIIIITVSFIVIWKLALHKENKSSIPKTMIVKKSIAGNTLFYTGIIQPLKTVVIPSPVDGAIIDMPFQYGDEVKAGQLLFKLSSSKFLSDYKSALMQYVKAKNDFNTTKIQLSESEFLHKNQLISDDDFKMKQSAYYASQLALLQAKDALEMILHQLHVTTIDLSTLSIADIDKITNALHLNMTSKHLQILSPTTGIILAASKGNEDSKKITKGDMVKEGDVLAVIGDMNGLSVRIKVSELTINQLEVGRKVKMTGIAFPEQELEGVIQQVDRQGEGSANGLPTFSVLITVPTLTPLQKKLIHVGMSAKVEIKVEDEPSLMLPISAVKEKNGNFYVRLYNEKRKSIHEVEVVTGKTSQSSVAINHGLKPGDHVVIAD